MDSDDILEEDDEDLVEIYETYNAESMGKHILCF